MEQKQVDHFIIKSNFLKFTSSDHTNVHNNRLIHIVQFILVTLVDCNLISKGF